MILTFIAFAVLAAGLYMYIKGYKPCNVMLMDYGIVAAVVGTIVAFIMVIFIIMAHVGVDVTIEKNRIEYESLCQQYEIVTSEYEDVSKTDVIKDIAEWNKKVYSQKHWAYNPWTSWFYSKRVADDMKMIEIRGKGES